MDWSGWFLRCLVQLDIRSQWTSILRRHDLSGTRHLIIILYRCSRCLWCSYKRISLLVHLKLDLSVDFILKIPLLSRGHILNTLLHLSFHFGLDVFLYFGLHLLIYQFFYMRKVIFRHHHHLFLRLCRGHLLYSPWRRLFFYFMHPRILHRWLIMSGVDKPLIIILFFILGFYIDVLLQKLRVVLHLLPVLPR